MHDAKRVAAAMTAVLHYRGDTVVPGSKVVRVMETAEVLAAEVTRLDALMQDALTVLQSCERALLTTWGSEDDIDVPTCREITFDVSKLLMKCNKPSVLDPKTLGPVQ